MTTNPTTTPDPGWQGDRSRGAGMGRDEYDMDISGIPARSVYLSQVRLDNQGYDPGGAYWGWGIGTPLYCAYSNEVKYCQYTRARDRAEAAEKLGLTDRELKRPLGNASSL
jgi:hypothetical protein